MEGDYLYFFCTPSFMAGHESLSSIIQIGNEFV